MPLSHHIVFESLLHVLHDIKHVYYTCTAEKKIIELTTVNKSTLLKERPTQTPINTADLDIPKNNHMKLEGPIMVTSNQSLDIG